MRHGGNHENWNLEDYQQPEAVCCGGGGGARGTVFDFFNSDVSERALCTSVLLSEDKYKSLIYFHVFHSS
jgi:hypothetical protein